MSQNDIVSTIPIPHDSPHSPVKISHLVVKCLNVGGSHKIQEFPHLKTKAFLTNNRDILPFQLGSRTNGFNKKLRSISPTLKGNQEKKNPEALEFESNKIKQEEKQIKEKISALESAIKSSSVSDKFTAEFCFEILNQLFKNLKFQNFENIITNLVLTLQTFVFFKSENLQENIENIFGTNEQFYEKTWKDVVKELCLLSDELKNNYEERIKDLMSEHIQEMNLLKKKIIEQESNYVSEIKKLKDEIFSYEEKIEQQKIVMQKISNENSKIKFQYQNEFDILSEEKEKSEHLAQKSFHCYSQQIEDLKKHHEEKEKEFFNLESEYDQAKHKIQKMIILLKESKNKITALESQITTLKTETLALQNRISISQGDLTPRPTFEKFQSILEVSEDFFKNKSTKNNIENLFIEWKKHAHVYIPKQSFVANSPTIIISSSSIIDDENKKEMDVLEKNDKKKKRGSKKCLSPFQEKRESKNLTIITKFNKEQSYKSKKTQTPKIKILMEEKHECFSNRER